MLSALLGVEPADEPDFLAVGSDLSALLDWSPEADSVQRANTLVETLAPTLRRLLSDRRRRPGCDLVTALAAQGRARSIRYSDVVVSSLFVFMAGYMTTTNLIGNGGLLLLQRPDARRTFERTGASGRAAVDELLRFDSPVQVTPRTALADLDLAGRRIRRGDIVLALLGAANRDDTVFAAADDLDLSRDGNRHVAFGAGPHRCVGASLSRLVGGTALSKLFAHYPDVQLTGEPIARAPSVTQRGLVSLRLDLGRSTGRG